MHGKMSLSPEFIIFSPKGPTIFKLSYTRAEYFRAPMVDYWIVIE